MGSGCLLASVVTLGPSDWFVPGIGWLAVHSLYGMHYCPYPIAAGWHLSWVWTKLRVAQRRGEYDCLLCAVRARLTGLFLSVPASRRPWVVQAGGQSAV